jgi:hypothetical protein
VRFAVNGKANHFGNTIERPSEKGIARRLRALRSGSIGSVHMLTNPSGSKWHCFYLTFRDVAGVPSTREHHWREGAHVHFVNYLFSPQRLTRRAVLEQLAEREHSIRGLHIRYDVGREVKDTGERLYADPRTGRFAKIQFGKPGEPTGGGSAEG